MTNVADNPNHIRIHGETVVSHWFSNLRSCIHVPHRDIVRLEFGNRVGVELDPMTATELARRLQEALGSFPPGVNLGGHAWTGDDT